MIKSFILPLLILTTVLISVSDLKSFPGSESSSPDNSSQQFQLEGFNFHRISNEGEWRDTELCMLVFEEKNCELRLCIDRKGILRTTCYRLEDLVGKDEGLGKEYCIDFRTWRHKARSIENVYIKSGPTDGKPPSDAKASGVINVANY